MTEDCTWLARAATFTRCYLGGDHPPGDHLAAGQFPSPRRGRDYHAEPAAPDIPAIRADVDSSQLSAAQPPQVLGMHDASNRNHVRPCSRKPPRGNQDLGPGQDTHHNSMGTAGARTPTAAADPRQRRRPPRKERPPLPLHTRPSDTTWFLASDFRTIEDEDSLDPVGGM